MRLMLDRLIFSLVGGLIGGGTYSVVLRPIVVGKNVGFMWIDLVWAFLACLVGGLLFYLVYPEVVSFFRLMQRLFSRLLRRMAITDVVILIFSLFLTVVIYIFSEPILRFALRNDPNMFNLVSFLMTPVLFLIIWMTGMAKRDSIIESTRNFIGAQNTSSQDGLFLLDSSSLIDGRVADLLTTTTLVGKFAVPSFVMFDLQRISDSPDPILSHRGKRGMITLEKIQEQMGNKLEIIPSGTRGRQTDLLVKLSKEGWRIVSCDMEVTSELRKLGVTVINLNEAASALKTVIVPGEESVVTVIKEGKEQAQGVGFLDDGTMVVIEDGRKVIGQTVRILCTSLLQNPQGRIVFGKIIPK